MQKIKQPKTMKDWAWLADSIFMVVFTIAASYALLVSFVPYWDTLMYHMPFAARMAHLYSFDDFSTIQILEERYQGFPMLVEFLQGWFWRLLQRPEGINLINSIAFVSLALFLRIRSKIPFIVSLIFYFSIPTILVGSLSAYIDVFVGVFIALGFLALYYFWISGKVSDGYWALAFFAVANNSKYTALLFVVFAFLFFLKMFFEIKKPSFKNIAIVAFLWMIVFFPQIRNLIVYQNPIYPQKPPLLSTLMPNGTQENKYEDQGPEYLKGSLNSVKFAYSFFEINAYDAKRPLLWTIDQGDVLSSSKSFRMGGYFFVNILFWLVLSIVLLRLKGISDTIKTPKVFGSILLLTVVVSCMPQSHELRYWLFIPILLFSFVLIYGKQAYHTKKYRTWAWGVVGVQIGILVFVIFHAISFALIGRDFSYYKINANILNGQKEVCFIAGFGQQPFMYRLSTVASMHMQVAESQKMCKKGYEVFHDVQ